MTEEEKSVINKLESIRVNVEGKLYNFEAARILYLITKLQKENEVLTTALSKQSKDIGNYLAELQQKDKQIDLMAKKLNQAYFDEDKFCIWFEKMMGVQEKMDYGYVVDLIKQYFERKATNID